MCAAHPVRVAIEANKVSSVKWDALEHWQRGSVMGQAAAAVTHTEKLRQLSVLCVFLVRHRESMCDGQTVNRPLE